MNNMMAISNWRNEIWLLSNSAPMSHNFPLTTSLTPPTIKLMIVP